MSATTPDTRDTGDGTTCAPGLGTGLVTCYGLDRVGLPLVLPHVGVDELDHISPDGRLEDSRERGLGGGLAALPKHSN